MEKELNRIIEMTKKKYNIEKIQEGVAIFLVIHDDGSEYIQIADEDDLYGIYSASGHLAGDEIQWGGYKAIIKLL